MMLKHVADKVHSGGLLLLAFSLSACSGNASQGGDDSAVADYPVQWTEEYSMASMLEEPSSASSLEDLRRLMGRQWYAGIQVIKSDAESPVKFASCDDYFAGKEADLHVYNAQEHSAFLELVVMCEATRLFVEATPARHSAIPAEPLTEDLPESLPKSLAFITSESESQRVQEDSSISTWAEVSDITQMNRVSEHRVVYHLDSGEQNVAILGRGDFDRDGGEDLLVSIQDTVEGGSYYRLRLLVLSVAESGDWIVDAQHPPR